jgi:hypothetical protein
MSESCRECGTVRLAIRANGRCMFCDRLRRRIASWKTRKASRGFEGSATFERQRQRAIVQLNNCLIHRKAAEQALSAPTNDFFYLSMEYQLQGLARMVGYRGHRYHGSSGWLRMKFPRPKEARALAELLLELAENQLVRLDLLRDIAPLPPIFEPPAKRRKKR